MIAKYSLERGTFYMDCYFKDKRVYSFRFHIRTHEFTHRCFPMQTGINVPFPIYYRWCKRFIRICSILFRDYDYMHMLEIKRICDVVNV